MQSDTDKIDIATISGREYIYGNDMADVTSMDANPSFHLFGI